MGVSMSRRRAARARAKSDIINRQIEADNKLFENRCRILLLGTNRSGKSTILKQMKITYQGGFSTSELAKFRPTVYKNVLHSAQAVVVYIRKAGLECADAGNNVHCEEILNYKLDAAPGSSQHPHFSPGIADAIHRLWNDPMIVKIMGEHLDNPYLMDNAAYFFDEVLRIGMSGYVPNKADILYAYQKSVGITDIELEMDPLSLYISDISSRAAGRPKWLHCFEDVTCIIFCVAISDYDRVLLDDKSQNRLSESLVLFESVINSRWFSRSSFFLYFTKIDVFKKKLSRVPLEHYFTQYAGGNDVEKAMKYILSRFMQANRSHLSVYPHLTLASDLTDTNSVRPVFTAVKETILQNALNDHVIQCFSG